MLEQNIELVYHPLSDSLMMLMKWKKVKKMMKKWWN